MSHLLLSLLYFSVFIIIGLGGYRLYKVLNKKIKEAETGWQLTCYSLLLFVACAVLLTGGLYIFIELYAFLARPKP